MKKFLSALAYFFSAVTLGFAVTGGYMAAETLSTESTMQVTVIRAPADAPVYSRTVDNNNRRFTPLIRLLRDDGGTFCSATVISNNYALTAAHCFGEDSLFKKAINKQFTIQGADKDLIKSDKMTAKVIAMNRTADYALIQGDFTAFERLPVIDAPHLFFQGYSSRLFTCGYPYGSSEVCYPTGTEFRTEGHLVAVAGRLFPAMSGGPVINPILGAIVAVNSANGYGFIVIAPTVGIFDNLGITVSK